MSEIGDRLRGLFEEIAPRPDVRGLLRRPIEESRPVRSWAIALGGVTAALGITLFVLVTLGQDQEPPLVVTTLPGTTTVSTTVPDTTATTAVGEDPIASLAPHSVECRLIDQGLVVFPCAEVTDLDDSTAAVVRWEGGLPSFTMTFDEPVTVHALRLRNLVDLSGFLRRARIQGVEVTSETGASAVVAFADENTEQVLSLEPAVVSGREITVSATALYPPQSFEDQPPILEFALAELTLIGRTAASEMVLDAWVGEWSQVTVDPARRGIAQAIAFNGESFALITRMDGGDIVVWESADGLEWRETANLGEDVPRDLTYSAVLDGWVTVGDRDGRATAWIPGIGGWYQVTIDDEPNSPGSVALSVIERAGRLVASGYFSPSEPGIPPVVTPALWVSDDGGASWRATELPQTPPWWIHSVVSGPGGFLGVASSTVDVAVGPEFIVLYRSFDGLTWERITPIGLAARQVDRGFADRDGYVLLDSPSGRIWTSADGIRWEVSELPTRPRSGEVLAHFVDVGRYRGSLVLAGAESYNQPNGFNTVAPIAVSQTVGGWAVTGRIETGDVYLLASGVDRLVMVGELVGPAGGDGHVTVFVFRPDDQPETLPCTDRMPPLPDQDLPAAVAETRRAIYEAVIQCDWVALSRLASQGEFLYTVGGQGAIGDPTEYWIERMRQGEDILGEIAAVLALPPRQVTFGNDGETEWVWPTIAYKDDPSGADWQELLPLYDQDQIDEMRDRGSYQGGFLLQIGLDGRWTFAGRMLD